MKMDIHASNMYALGIAKGSDQTIIGADFKNSPIFIRE